MPVLCVRSRDRTEDQRIGRRSVTQRCCPSNVHLPTRHASSGRERKIILPFFSSFDISLHRVREKKSVSRIPHNEIQHREKWRRERNIFGGFQKFCKNFDRSKLKRATAVSLLVRAVGSSCEYNSRYLGEHAFPPPYVRRG